MGIGCCSCSKKDLKGSIFISALNDNKNLPGKTIQNKNIIKGEINNINNDNISENKYQYPSQKSLNIINEKFIKNNITNSKKSEEYYFNSNTKIIYEEEGIIDSLIRNKNQ